MRIIVNNTGLVFKEGTLGGFDVYIPKWLANEIIAVWPCTECGDKAMAHAMIRLYSKMHAALAALLEANATKG